MRVWSIFRFCAFFRGFLLLTFVRGISESRHQRIWNQHKILRFFDTHIFKHFAKSKKVIFLPLSIILRLIPIEIPKKYKIERGIALLLLPILLQEKNP